MPKERRKVEVAKPIDYLNVLPNQGEYRQECTVWIALLVASKGSKITEKEFQAWTGEPSGDLWKNANVNNCDGYGFKTLQICARASLC